MKKLTAALLLSAYILCACASEPVDHTTPVDPVTESASDSVGSTAAETSAAVPEAPYAGFALTVGAVRLLPGVTVGVDALLGKPLDTLTAPSCVHEGNDIVYYYDGMEIVTSPSAAGNYIVSITLTGENRKTEEGISVGSSLADVTAAYGAFDKAKSVPDFGRYVFFKAKTSLTVLTDLDNTVISISYSYEE